MEVSRAIRPEGDVDPEVVAAALEGESEGVARLLGLAGLPDLEPLLEVGPHLLDASGMDQLEARRLDPPQADPARAAGHGRVQPRPGPLGRPDAARSGPAARASPRCDSPLRLGPPCPSPLPPVPFVRSPPCPGPPSYRASRAADGEGPRDGCAGRDSVTSAGRGRDFPRPVMSRPCRRPARGRGPPEGVHGPRSADFGPARGRLLPHRRIDRRESHLNPRNSPLSPTLTDHSRKRPVTPRSGLDPGQDPETIRRLWRPGAVPREGCTHDFNTLDAVLSLQEVEDELLESPGTSWPAAATLARTIADRASHAAAGESQSRSGRGGRADRIDRDRDDGRGHDPDHVSASPPGALRGAATHS